MTAAAESTDQAVPFQCSRSVLSWWRPRTLNPTAQASDAVLALTPRRLAFTPRLGVATSDQAVPFQW